MSLFRLLRAPLFVAALSLCFVSQAADPAAGTLSPASPEITYTGGPYTVSDPVPVGCADIPEACDDFALTLNLPANYASTNPGAKVVIELSWSPQQTDLDLALLNSAGAEVATSGNLAGTPERIEFAAGQGSQSYTIRIKVFVGTGVSSSAVVRLEPGSSGGGGNQPPVVQAPAGPFTPRYQIYTPPAPFGESAGEPSLGYNVDTKRMMYIAGLQTLRGTVPENLDPPQPESCEADWEDKTFILTGLASLDPIIFTDQKTNRTFVSQLNSTPAGPVLVGMNSYFAYTDDDGETWTPGQLDAPNGSLDHQTVGAGPYPAALRTALSNPQNGGSAVYYCSQAYVTGLCARSDTGGLTFNRPTPAYNDVTDGCGSIHGHVKVAPDGSVYLPHNNCASDAAVSVSEDAGTTWTVRHVTGSTLPISFGLHPAVAVASDSKTLYYCQSGENADVFAHVSRDEGVTWDPPVNLSKLAGLKSAVFAEVIAGDPDRAACGFLGSTEDGNSQALDFPGIWHLYMAHTYDGGKTWEVVNATPGDPVQHAGGIWNQGGASVNRNLLDFNEMTLDEKGYVLYSFADGCIGSCVPNGPNSYSEKANVARQRGGKPLYAAFDRPQPQPPAQSCLAGRRDDTGSFLTWRKPDSGGSPITRYDVFRSTSPTTGFVQIGQTAGKPAFVDRSAEVTTAKYFYRVTATTAVATGQISNIVELPIGPRPATDGPCVQPGTLVVSAPTGDPTIPNAAFDIQSVSIAEPANLEGKLVFTLKVASLASVPTGWRWAVRFKPPAAPPPFATGAASEDFHVSMITSDGAAPSFTYGYTGLPNENAPGRFFVSVGDLEAGSGFSPDGTITFVIDKADIGNPKPGDPIIAIFGSVRASGPSDAPGTGGVNQTIPDSTGSGAYTLRAANFCLPNMAPIAVLTASATKVGIGDTVNFDGTGSSDADTGIDTVAKFAFNFGDGSEEVEQSQGKVSYKFPKEGSYAVKLFVTDSRGKVSSNAGRVVVEVGKAGATPGTPGTPAIPGAPTVSGDTGRFGGALVFVLLPLGFAALRQRRR